MKSQEKDLFDEEDGKKPKVIVQKKLPPQTEAMDLPETGPNSPPRPKGRAARTEATSETAPEKPKAVPASAAPKPKAAASGGSKKARPVSISEDTYWAIKKKLVDLRKEMGVDEVLEEAVRLWIRHK
ncbi:MAG TPA: hypothetical protein VFD58_07675 [Blastocatellia bacterium]|nr:hypothetical protein [Blastocatellia bacterium]